MKLSLILIFIILILAFLFKRKEVASKTTSSFLEDKRVKSLSIDTKDVIYINFSVNNEFKEIQELFKRLDDILDNGLMNQVRKNILSRGDIYDWKEYHIYEYEFKKLLILSQLVKDLPVYNEKVLIILNEFLLLADLELLKDSFLNIDNIISLSNKEKIVENHQNVSKDELFFMMYFYLFEDTGLEEEIYPILNKFIFSKKCLLYLFENDIEKIRKDLFEDNLDFNELIYVSIILFKRKQEVAIIKPKKHQNLYYANKKVVDVTENNFNDLHYLYLYKSIQLNFDLMEEDKIATRRKINEVNINVINDYKKFNLIDKEEYDKNMSLLNQKIKEIDEDEDRIKNPNNYVTKKISYSNNYYGDNSYSHVGYRGYSGSSLSCSSDSSSSDSSSSSCSSSSSSDSGSFD